MAVTPDSTNPEEMRSPARKRSPYFMMLSDREFVRGSSELPAVLVVYLQCIDVILQLTGYGHGAIQVPVLKQPFDALNIGTQPSTRRWIRLCHALRVLAQDRQARGDMNHICGIGIDRRWPYSYQLTMD
jgi:hypothetical protein